MSPTMAPSTWFALGVASLCWWSASAQASDDFEVFPLSGGIDNGVKLTVTATSIGENALVEFRQPDRTVVFGWHFDTTNQKIVRSSAVSGESETWGGWPAGFSGLEAVTIVFEKRKHEWAISINGERFPWYDFKHRHDSTIPITHVAVYSGIMDAEVVLKRPPCTVPCHADECLKQDGENGCPDATCYSTTRSSDRMFASECSDATETTPDADMHCCDGLPLTIDLTAARVGQYTSIISDVSYIERLCLAMSGDSCNGLSDQHSQKARIRSVDKSSGVISIFVPNALDQDLQKPDYEFPATSLFDVSSFALRPSYGPNEELIVLPDQSADDENPFSNDDLKVDGHTSVIYGLGDLSVAANIPKGWYINLLRYPVTSEDYRWVEYSDTVHILIGASPKNGLQLWVADEEVPVNRNDPDQCTDAADFKDKYGAECNQYRAGDWCTHRGEVTEAGCDHWNQTFEDGCFMPDDGQGYNAIVQCCYCGGGYHVAPEAPAQLFYM